MRLTSKTPANQETLSKSRNTRRTESRQDRGFGNVSSVSQGVGVAIKRKSQRKSTVLSSQILHLRLKDAEERRAALPKRLKDTSANYTQAELLARALDNEEGNIISHRNYLEDEEEKRKRARVVKRNLSGPVLSWVSRIEEETFSVEPRPSNANPAVVLTGSPHSTKPSNDASVLGGGTGYSAQQPYGSAPLPNSYFSSSAALQALSQPSVNARSSKTERVVKNYLLHKLDEGSLRPGWSETMNAVFGGHTDWNEVRVYVGKHRPPCTCLIHSRSKHLFIVEQLDQCESVPSLGRRRSIVILDRESPFQVLTHIGFFRESKGTILSGMTLSVVTRPMRKPCKLKRKPTDWRIACPRQVWRLDLSLYAQDSTHRDHGTQSSP